MSNYKNVSVKISGLEPNATYSYMWNGLGGNWPALLGAKSGVIASDAYSTTYDVNTGLQFCSTTGSCQGEANLLPYSIESCDIKSTDVYSVLELIIKKDVNDAVQLTKNIRVNCEDCTGKPSVEPTYVNTLSASMGNSSDIKVDLANLIPNKKYTYKFYSLGGNWPVTISNISGTFVPNSASSQIFSRITFNEATGIISDNIFNNSTPTCFDDFDLTATIGMELIADQDCNSQQVYTSDPMTFSCQDCLGNISVEDIQDTVLTKNTGSTGHLHAKINNVQKNKSYNYQFHSAGGNWPINLTNVSGTFIANNNTFYNLDSMYSFCDSEEVCNVGNNGILTATNVCLQKDHKMNTLYLYVEPANCQLQAGVSNQFTLSCDDCFIDPEVTMSTGKDIIIKDTDVEISAASQVSDFTVTFNNLTPKTTYGYKFESIDGNWPVIADPPSGEFRARETTQTFGHKAIFALPTGDALNNPGALAYNITSYNQEYENKFNKFHTVLYNKECSGLYYEGANIDMQCDDCLPCLNCSTISFSGAPILELPLSCCSGTDMMFVSITGANPDTAYKYQLASLSGQVNFVPHTGVVYIGRNGKATVPVLMTTALTNREQGLAQATLTDIGTGAESLGFLGLLCGEECNSNATYLE